jgi:hypothetical protein
VVTEIHCCIEYVDVTLATPTAQYLSTMARSRFCQISIGFIERTDGRRSYALGRFIWLFALTGIHFRGPAVAAVFSWRIG